MQKSPAKLRWWVSLALLVCAAMAHAQGGPPFRTDDPGTPGTNNWELNVGFVGTRNPGAGSYQVPDFDLNYGLGERLQLKFEVPIALQETVAQPATKTDPATPGKVVGGLGSLYPGIKWRFYEHKPGKSYWGDGAFGTGLLAVFGKKPEQKQPAEETVGAEAPEPEPDLNISTYPQLFLNNGTSAVRRNVVPAGPNLWLPIEVSGKIGWLAYNGEVGYYFGNSTVAQSWGRGLLLGHAFGDRNEEYFEFYDAQDANRKSPEDHKQRQITMGLGGRQALNKKKTLNFLWMGARAIQAISANNSEPSWTAYVGVQILWGPTAAAPEPALKGPLPGSMELPKK